MRITAHACSSLACLAFCPALILANPDTDSRSVLDGSNKITTVASTVPANGDVNPYGVAIVPVTRGTLVAGNVLVSNFNDSGNFQGTGSTIVQIDKKGDLSVFAELTPNNLPGDCPGGIGLTTALVSLRSGFVIVGSLPTVGGDVTTAQAGCLIVLDSSGNPVLTLSGGAINGPWDMTALDLNYAAVLFVTNVLNGTVNANGGVVSGGSVVRIVLSTPAGFTPRELSRTTIATGFSQRTDPMALVIGPTGVGLGGDGTLYIADTLNNRIAMIPNALIRTSDAGAGSTLSENGALNGPLGLAIATNGNILTANGGDGNMVETTPRGKQIAVKPVDVSQQGGGTLFGLAVADGSHVYYVDDGNNTLNLLH